VPPFLVKVTAAYGPLMPSLHDLSGEPADGYETVAKLACNPDGRPRHWFVEQHSEFSPALLVLGRFYDVESSGQMAARVEAEALFEAELSRHGLPLPSDPVYTELAHRR
jgi:hypothetical protein